MLRLRLLLCLCIWLPAAHGESLQSLPSPLPASHVADARGLLAADTRRELDRLAGTLDGAGRGQLAFVVIASTDGVDPRRYATELFNRWGVGHRGRNDGTLFLLAREDRAAEIVLGDGIDTPTNRALAERIMSGEMVPRFRQGDYDQALIVGASMLLTRVYAMDLSRPAEQPADAAPNALVAADTLTVPASATPLSAQPRPVATPDSGAGSDVQKGPSDSTAIAIGLAFFAAVFAFLTWVVVKITRLIWWFSGSRWLSRKCKRCSAQMHLLGEVEDDAHLDATQQTEERLRSVDHRVFLCPACANVEKLTRRAWFTRYSDCNACHSRALSSVSKTITSATRWSTGLAEVTSTCQHCGKVSMQRQTLPMLTSSSSSSSGSSYGGGRSSGGGASGRW